MHASLYGYTKRSVVFSSWVVIVSETVLNSSCFYKLEFKGWYLSNQVDKLAIIASINGIWEAKGGGGTNAFVLCFVHIWECVNKNLLLRAKRKSGSKLVVFPRYGGYNQRMHPRNGRDFPFCANKAMCHVYSYESLANITILQKMIEEAYCLQNVALAHSKIYIRSQRNFDCVIDFCCALHCIFVHNLRLYDLMSITQRWWYKKKSVDLNWLFNQFNFD